jgi:hypothetical protein
MVNVEQAARIKPPLTRRIKFGLGATAVTLVLLVFPGQMVLPLYALLPLMPRMGGCANFLAPVIFIIFIGAGFLLSVVLIIIGIVAIVLAAVRKRIGLVGAVLVNAAVVSLLLLTPLDFPASGDPGAFGLYVLLAICALIPAAAMVLLLSRTVFRSWWHSSRPFIATAVAAGLLVLPGAAGTVALGFQVRDFIAPQPAAAQPASSVPSGHTC